MAKTKEEVKVAIAKYLQDHPDVTYKELAERLGCGMSTITNIAGEYGIRRTHRRIDESVLELLKEAK